MASFFEKALQVVLRHEGGLVDNPADPGGITNYGISLRLLEELGIDVDGDGDVDADDIRALTQITVKPLYWEHFWVPGGFDAFAAETVATKLFDMAVNMGHARANKLAQTAANACGANLAVDGVLGPKSVAAINVIDPQVYIPALCKVQAGFYTDLAARKPKLAVFLKGWLRRAAWPEKQH